VHIIDHLRTVFSPFDLDFEIFEYQPSASGLKGILAG